MKKQAIIIHAFNLVLHINFTKINVCIKDDTRREAFCGKIAKLMTQLIQHAPIDSAVDQVLWYGLKCSNCADLSIVLIQMAAEHIHNSLPPVLTEGVCVIFDGVIHHVFIIIISSNRRRADDYCGAGRQVEWWLCYRWYWADSGYQGQVNSLWSCKVCRLFASSISISTAADYNIKHGSLPLHIKLL